MSQRISSMTIIGALAASLVLAGCNKNGQQGAGNSGADSTGTVGQTGRAVGNDVAAGVDRAKDAASNATAKVGDKIDDAMITASVKTELAKDANLSALSINVDTAAGRVALKGTAPTAAAKAQATLLAQNVKGVMSVDNQLTVKQ